MSCPTVEPFENLQFLAVSSRSSGAQATVASGQFPAVLLTVSAQPRCRVVAIALTVQLQFRVVLVLILTQQFLVVMKLTGLLGSRLVEQAWPRPV